MHTKQRRHKLKTKETKQLLEEASQSLRVNLEILLGVEVNLEVIESDVGVIYVIEGKPLLIRVDDRIIPTLLFTEFVARAPKVVVDMGAIPYVCKGATVMAPGIVRIEGEFEKGDILLVSDVKHNKALAVGESLIDAGIAKNTKKGPVVKNLHYVSDKIWEYIKALNS